MTKYEVMRHHTGDKEYAPGDAREAKESDVTHLVKNGVLRAASGEKAASAPANKADPRPDNKAAPKPATKAKG